MIQKFKILLKRNDWKKGFDNIIAEFFIFGLLISIGVLICTNFILGIELIFSLGASILCLPVPLILLYLYHNMKFEFKQKELERKLADLLLEASISSKEDFNRMLKSFVDADLGILSKEFSIALEKINKGASVEDALKDIKQRYNSKFLNVVIDLLLQQYYTGAEMQEVFRNTADDIFNSQEILRERKSALIIEKYTILFAGSAIVPFVLALITNFVKSIGNSFLFSTELLDVAIFSTQIYIIEYAILASIFVAFIEGNPKRFILYCLALIPLSLIIFNFAPLVM